MLSDLLSRALASPLFWMFSFLVLLFIFVIVRDQRNDLIKEKQKLENHVVYLEKYKNITERAVSLIDVSSREQIFTQFIERFLEGGLSKDFLQNIISVNDDYFFLMKKVILHKIKEIENDHNKGTHFFPSFSSYDMHTLLEYLEEENKKRIGKVRFIDAPDILFDQARKNTMFKGVNIP